MQKLKKWWNTNGQIWANELRLLIIRSRNFGHQWHFTEQQKEILKQYYTASQLLVDCLNSPCKATPIVAESILATLLLPTSKILMRYSR
ncbi:hypothetical protein [uncultured Nostoc sp.]|uniref:NACHT C-terminal helical domain 2-containing protein n=1 Tax=uncultured Nostoc sp. TaxID=340711 RepID=UPI0035CA6D54